MPWSAGTFTRTYGSTGWQSDAAAGTPIVADRHDTNDQDLATGINACLNKDGTNFMAANLNMGGFIPTNLGAGTAAAPAICAGNDQDTGMFSPAANQIGIATNGTERMRIGSDGRVAIGTNLTTGGHLTTRTGTYTVPQLLVQGTGTGAGGSGRSGINIDVDGNGGWLLENDASGGSRTLKISDNNGFGVGAVERFRINSSGQTIMTAGVAGGFAASVTNTNTGATSYGLIVDQARSDYALAVRDNTNIYRHIFNANGTATIGVTTNPAITINPGGEVLCGSATDNGNYNLQCNGTGVWGAGAYVNGSDERIKEDILPLGDSLNIINALNPVTFKYKEEWINDSTTQPGFIAQEVEQVLSNELYKDGIVQAGGQYMGLAYQSLIPLIVKAMQELSTKLDALTERVEALEV